MESTSKKRPTPVQGLVITIAGIVIMIAGLRDAATAFEGTVDSSPVGSFVLLGTGALIFSIGLMLLLVAVARPLFQKRPQDSAVESGEHHRRP